MKSWKTLLKEHLSKIHIKVSFYLAPNGITVKWQLFPFDPSKRDEKGTVIPWGLHGLPSWTPWPVNPQSDIPLTHTHKSGFQSVWQSFYLIVASKTWTVESLSKETVLITNLTAFWNSDEFPIIFKKRNTSHYDGMKWWGYMIAGAGPHHLNICTCCGFATHGSRNRKAQLSLRTYSGTDGKPISTKLKNQTAKLW